MPSLLSSLWLPPSLCPYPPPPLLFPCLSHCQVQSTGHIQSTISSLCSGFFPLISIIKHPLKHPQEPPCHQFIQGENGRPSGLDLCLGLLTVQAQWGLRGQWRPASRISLLYMAWPATTTLLALVCFPLLLFQETALRESTWFYKPRS